MEQASPLGDRDLRAAFETRTESLRAIAAELGVSMTTLRRRALKGGWVRAPGAPASTLAAGTTPHSAPAWRRRLQTRLRRLLERYIAKLETWLLSPSDVSEQSAAEAERYAKTIIALVRGFADLDALAEPGAAPARITPLESDREREKEPDFDTLLVTLERRLDQLATADASPGRAL